MFLKNLHLSNFRNYNELSIEFSSDGAVFEGANGAGKTNLLESIYLLCTGKSQRNARRISMIKNGSEFSYIEGTFFSDDSKNVTASFGFDLQKKTMMKVNDQPVNSITEWFGKRPIVSFGADDLDLVYGAPENRRKFIDITCSQIYPDYLQNLFNYLFYLRNRNSLLSQKFDPVQCEIYEQKMAEYGSYLVSKRESFINDISLDFLSFYKEICDDKEQADLLYKPSFSFDCSSKESCKNVFYNVLQERRKRDLESGFSSIGPHRDDIVFMLDEKPVKQYGSQGQCRSIVLSLKLSSVVCIEKYRKEKMIFLIDDAVAELDPKRTSRVIPLIESKGQIFIATPVFTSQLKKSLPHFLIDDGKVIC